MSNKHNTDKHFLWIMIAISISFTGFIWVLAPYLPSINFAPDTGYLHYFWKLPNPNFWSHFTSWGGYILHQVIAWVILYLAQKNPKPFDDKLNKYNYWMLGTHVIFFFVHLIQSHIWYDGIAQDVSILASQGSVIIMLVMIMILLNRRRGVLLGKKLSIPAKVENYVSKNHGYYIMWALVFTYWYHPMEGTMGHLVGFLYMFLLMMQSATFYTRVHLNKYWILFLEFFVLLHGSLVAISTGNGMWPMFAFGFGFMTIFAQVYILKLKKWQYTLLQIIYILLLLLIYGGLVGDFRTINQVYEVAYIPVTDYVLLLLMIPLYLVGFKVVELIGNIIKKRKKE